MGFCPPIVDFFLQRRDRIVKDATKHQAPFLVVVPQERLLSGILEGRTATVPIKNNPHRWRGTFNSPYVIQDMMMSIINAPMSCEQGYQNVPQGIQPFNVDESCHLARQGKNLGLPILCTIFALGSICPSIRKGVPYKVPIIRVNRKGDTVLDSVPVDQPVPGPVVIPMSKKRACCPIPC